jgi:hypothetical protein
VSAKVADDEVEAGLFTGPVDTGTVSARVVDAVTDSEKTRTTVLVTTGTVSARVAEDVTDSS